MIELREHRLAILAVLVCLLYQDLDLCWSLNDEGKRVLLELSSDLGALFGL